MAGNLAELTRFAKCMIEDDTEFHFSTLGIKVDDLSFQRAQMTMPYSPAVIGDPETGVIHGGAITALLDTCCGFAAATTLDELAMTPTIDLRIDYMCSAEPGKAVVAEAEVYRSTEYVIFTRAMAHQGDRRRPVACAVGNFFRLPVEAFAEMREAFHRGLLPAQQGSVNR